MESKAQRAQTIRMKLYTKIGDKEQTVLISMEKVSKSHPLIDAYGTFDELNSVIGICVAQTQVTKFENAELVVELCKSIQNDLFQIGSYLADPKRETDQAIIKLNLSRKSINTLEAAIDFFSDACPPLRNFIIPGSNILNAYFHNARTVARRAERKVVSLISDQKLNSDILIYVNRLSDLFFALARYTSYKLNAAEVLYDKNVSV